MSHSNNVPLNVPYNSRGQIITGQPTHSQPSGFNQVAYDQGSNVVNQPVNAGFTSGYGPPQAPGATPGNVIFMERPPAIPGIPQGLEYLSQIDQLFIHQQVERFETITAWINKYPIKNSLGQQVYFAESHFCKSLSCGDHGGLVVHITNNFGAEVLRATIHFECCAGCNCCANIDCCGMELCIEAPVGQICGYARQTPSYNTRQFDILDANRQPVLNVIESINKCCQETRDKKFQIFTLQGSLIGKLSKQWSGFAREFFTDADNLSASFPLDLDVHMKAVLLCTVFLIDYMFSEE